MSIGSTEDTSLEFPAIGSGTDRNTVIALMLLRLSQWETNENKRRASFYMEKDIRDWKQQNRGKRPADRSPVPEPPLALHIDPRGYPNSHPVFTDGPDFAIEKYVPPVAPPPPPPGQMRMASWVMGDGTGRRLAMPGDTIPHGTTDVVGPDGKEYTKVIRNTPFGSVGWYEPEG